MTAYPVAGPAPREQARIREAHRRQRAVARGQGIQLRLDPVLTARFLMGGVVEVLLDWVNGDIDAPPDEIVDQKPSTCRDRRACRRPPAGQPARSLLADGDRASTVHQDIGRGSRVYWRQCRHGGPITMTAARAGPAVQQPGHRPAPDSASHPDLADNPEALPVDLK